MDDKPKSIWKKSWTGLRAVLIWTSVIATAIFLAVFLVALLLYSERPLAATFVLAALIGLICAICCLVVVCLVWPMLRWLFCKHWRRTLFASSCFATLIALFYAEEDWRGWHVWNQFKHEWEAKGERFDFASVVPPPVPD